jgi:hypothetical protein
MAKVVARLPARQGADVVEHVQGDTGREGAVHGELEICDFSKKFIFNDFFLF